MLGWQCLSEHVHTIGDTAAFWQTSCTVFSKMLDVPLQWLVEYQQEQPLPRNCLCCARLQTQALDDLSKVASFNCLNCARLLDWLSNGARERLSTKWRLSVKTRSNSFHSTLEPNTEVFSKVSRSLAQFTLVNSVSTLLNKGGSTCNCPSASQDF